VGEFFFFYHQNRVAYCWAHSSIVAACCLGSGRFFSSTGRVFFHCCVGCQVKELWSTPLDVGRFFGCWLRVSPPKAAFFLLVVSPLKGLRFSCGGVGDKCVVAASRPFPCCCSISLVAARSLHWLDVSLLPTSWVFFCGCVEALDWAAWKKRRIGCCMGHCWCVFLAWAADIYC
jgi:hypothetical protein